MLNMPLLTEDFIGRLCEIKSMDHVLIGITRITDIFDGDSVELAAPGNQDDMPVVYYHTRVKLIVHLRGVQIFEGLVYLSNKKFMRVDELKKIQDSDRRGAFRVETEAAAIITEMQESDGERPLDAIQLDVSVLDISMTGMRLACHAPLTPGETYRIAFTLSEHKYDLPVKVRRMYETKRGKPHYGVSFEEHTHYRQLEALSREIMRLHRHTLKKRIRRQ